MEDLTARLLVEPKVFVVAKTEFDREGLPGWIEMRGLETSEYYLNSPVKAMVDDTSRITPEQDQAEQVAEFAGRFCYNSMLKGRPTDEYIENVITMRHGSVLEHVNYTLAIEGVSRSLSHELVRHRAGFAISQESQRFVDAKDIRFVVPPILAYLWRGNLDCKEARIFAEQCERDLADYIYWQEYIVGALDELEDGVGVKDRTMFRKRANEAARAKLPNAAETKMTWTGNLRALRHFCELRGDHHADLEIRRLASIITEEMMIRAPYTFHDAETLEGDFDVPTTTFKFSKV